MMNDGHYESLKETILEWAEDQYPDVPEPEQFATQLAEYAWTELLGLELE